MTGRGNADTFRDSYATVEGPYADNRFSIESTNTVHIAYNDPRASINSTDTDRQHYHISRFSVESNSTLRQRYNDPRLSTASASTVRQHHALPGFARDSTHISHSLGDEPFRASFVPLEEDEEAVSPGEDQPIHESRHVRLDDSNDLVHSDPRSNDFNFSQSAAASSSLPSAEDVFSLQQWLTRRTADQSQSSFPEPIDGNAQAQEPVRNQQSSPTAEPSTLSGADVKVLFKVASLYEFNIDPSRREAGFPYLTYVAGEIFHIIREHGELWMGWNKDDPEKNIGWLWNKHFAKIAWD